MLPSIDIIIKELYRNDFTSFDLLEEDEKRIIETIFNEIQLHGKSDFLTDLWANDFECRPVNIDTFVSDDYYLGKIGKDLFPKWRQELRIVCDPTKEVSEWVIRGCVGAGKTTVAVIVLLYKIYYLCCLKDPQKFYGLMEKSPIVFGLFNIYKYLAQDTSYKYFINWAKLSPYFQDVMRRAFVDERRIPSWLQRLNKLYGIGNEEMANSYMRFPKEITLALGSSAIHALGQNIYGGLPLHKNTKIPLLDGSNIEIKDLSDKTFFVYSIDHETGKTVPAMASAFYSGKSRIYKITLDDDSHVKCSGEHRWMLRDGSYIETTKLKVNDSLMPFYRRINENGYEEIYNFDNWEKTHQVIGKFIYGKDLYKNPIEGEGPFVLHHLDLNKRNNDPNNLEIMTFKEHAKLHEKYVELMHSPESKLKWQDSMKLKYKDEEWLRKRRKISRDTINKLWDRYRNGENVGKFGAKEKNHSDSHRRRLSNHLTCLNKTDKMRKLSGDRLRKWNNENSEKLKKRGTEHLNKLWKNEEYRNKISELSRKKFVRYNKEVKRSKLVFDDLLDGASIVVNYLDNKGKNTRNENYVFTKELLYTLFDLRSSTVIDRILKENNYTWGEFCSIFGYKTKNHKIKKIELLNEVDDVYCLTVPSTHNYAVLSNDCSEMSGIYTHNCDETDMSRNKGITNEDKSKVEELYGQAKSRLDSRFLQKGGTNPGILVLVSQVTSRDSFLSEHVAKTAADPRTHVSQFAIWEIKDHKFPPEEPRFQVVVGDDVHNRSFIVDENSIIPKGAMVLDVPESLRPRFEYDVEAGIRDQAGIPTYGVNLFIKHRDKVFDCYRLSTDRVHPFTVDSVELSIDTEDTTDLISIFKKDLCMNRRNRYSDIWSPKWYPGSLRAIHVDLAKNKDYAGLAMGCIGDFKQIQRFDNDGKSYYTTDVKIFIDLALRIKPKKGSEIDFSKIRSFIYFLHSIGFPIKYCSYDGYNSVDSQQQLKKYGFDVKELSVDKSAAPYNCLKSVIYETRLDFYEYSPFTDEVTKLSDNSLIKGAKPVIDHPPKGRKDVADAITGVVFRLMSDKDTFSSLSGKSYDSSNFIDVQETKSKNDWVTKSFKTKNKLEKLFE